MVDFGTPIDLQVDGDALQIDAAEVRRLSSCGPSDRWNDAIASAVAEGRRLVRARARYLPVAPSSLDDLFEVPTPVAHIGRNGERCAVFLATIGPALEARVAEHLEGRRFLEGVLLDAVGSVCVEALCDAAEAQFAGATDTSSRYSPGYCAWPVASQPRLLGRLAPAELGVVLEPSFLMQPLKSVSGLIVVAPGELLEVPLSACIACSARGCMRHRSNDPDSAHPEGPTT